METCGHCLYCTTGQYNHCNILAFHGYNRNGGGLAQFTCVKRPMAHKLPPSMTGIQGALIEPMAISYRTAQRCKVEAGRRWRFTAPGPSASAFTSR